MDPAHVLATPLSASLSYVEKNDLTSFFETSPRLQDCSLSLSIECVVRKRVWGQKRPFEASSRLTVHFESEFLRPYLYRQTRDVFFRVLKNPRPPRQRSWMPFRACPRRAGSGEAPFGGPAKKLFSPHFSTFFAFFSLGTL